MKISKLNEIAENWINKSSKNTKYENLEFIGNTIYYYKSINGKLYRHSIATIYGYMNIPIYFQLPESLLILINLETSLDNIIYKTIVNNAISKIPKYHCINVPEINNLTRNNYNNHQKNMTWLIQMIQLDGYISSCLHIVIYCKLFNCEFIQLKCKIQNEILHYLLNYNFEDLINRGRNMDTIIYDKLYQWSKNI